MLDFIRGRTYARGEPDRYEHYENYRYEARDMLAEHAPQSF